MIWLYRYAGLVMLGILAWYALHLYHLRRQAALEIRDIELDGWVKLKLTAIPYAWQCPHCGFPALTSEAVRMHQDEHAQRDEQATLTAEVLGQQPPSVAVGAREDAWPALGQADDDEAAR